MNLRTRRRPVPQIPIVSLIDIMVVLLIFFMYNTTFRTQTTRMQIALPESKSMGSSTQAQDVRTALAISKTNELFLVLSWNSKPIPRAISACSSRCGMRSKRLAFRLPKCLLAFSGSEDGTRLR